jgi:3-hydroxyacyl-CoA dehydrogenase/enoyl-CoA hydratase/3-hydroxybutyryl-CoA epimerase
LIENVARQAGMPVGPLAVMDEVEISLMAKVAQTNRGLDELLGDDVSSVHAAMNAMARSMVAEGRTGRASGRGFYDYHADGGKVMSPLWTERFSRAAPLPAGDVRDRLIFRQVIETLDCLRRGVLSSARDANVGSILGWGFPVHTGGTVQFIAGIGRPAFVERAAELATQYGGRFAPPDALDLLLERAA